MGAQENAVKPTVLPPGEFGAEELDRLKRDNPIWRPVDIYESQLQELAEISHPGRPAEQQAFLATQDRGELAGAWVYYPWSGVLLHCVGPDELFALRTNRNRNLIGRDEQKRLADAVVAVAGMSVGSGIALACVYSGMSRHIKLADFDKLETANLNRLRESLADVGVGKAELAARRIYELDPFTEVRCFAEGLNDDNLAGFFDAPKTGLVIDEIDDFKMKVRLRQNAKRSKVPLLMFTSLGDNILVDVERYDAEPDLPIFNGAIGDTAEQILAGGDISPADAKRYAVSLVGQEYVPTKALASLPEIGETLAGRPQLYGTVTVDGGLAAYLAKRILLGQPLASGRYFIKFAELFGQPAADLAASPERQAILGKIFGDAG